MLVALLLLGLFAFVAVVFWGVWKVGHDQKKAEANAEHTLNELFDGSDNVTYNGHMRNLKYETVILGGKNRGYDVAHQAGDPKGAYTLIFEKR